jgi:predicted nucleic acid-binding protein
MTVVADTSPLNYLVLIYAIDILPRLFGRVLIPKAVALELQRPRTPPEVATWLTAQPAWLVIQAPAQPAPDPAADQELERLGAGEREAITLASGQRPDVLLLIDEGKGRRVANRLELRIIGTLGILELAAMSGLLDLPSALERLRRTTFYVAPSLLRTLLDRDAERKRLRR